MTAALIVKLHHTYTDGVGAMQLAGELFDIERQPPAPLAPPPPLPPWPRRPRLGGLWDDVAFETRRGFGLARAVIPWAAAALRDAAIDPQPRADEVRELVRSMGVAVTAAQSSGSRPLAARSTCSAFEAIDLPLADLRAAAGRAGGTVNDGFLAGILGGLRLYHAKHGARPPSVRIGIPVSTRGPSTEPAPVLRNQFVPLVVRAPLQLADPAERVRVLHALVLAARQPPAIDLIERATGVVRRLPGAVHLAAGLLGSVDLMASNVPGSPLDLYLAGAKVQRMIPFGPRGGAGLNLTLLSHHQTVHIGVNADPVALPDQDVLVDCLRRGFEETIA
jgi:WS/DGAT/MGAT family acyltransferase